MNSFMAAKNLLDSEKMPVRFHPGATLGEKLQELCMGVKEFAIRCGKPEKTIHAVLNGKSSVTSDMAIAFELVTHIPARFWLNKQLSYDEYVARQRLKEKKQEELEWAKAFPYLQMSKYGWIAPASKLEERLINLLSFFRISSQAAWTDYYCGSELKLAFKISLAGIRSPQAVSAWLRQGEIECERISLEKRYSPEALTCMLPSILSIVKDCPENFVQQLKDVYAYCGIKLIILKSLKEAPISGCSRWIIDTPCIILTDRYKRYDQFCFSLLHETCHVLKHGKKDIFLEQELILDVKADKEKEADKFASEFLFPQKLESEFISAGVFTRESVYKASKKFGVHPSVIVGRLQHNNIIQYNQLTDLIKHIEIA